jgi:hypothetical protein
MGLTSELRGMCDFWLYFVWAFCSRGKVNKVVTSIFFLLFKAQESKFVEGVTLENKLSRRAERGLWRRAGMQGKRSEKVVDA